MDENLNDQSTPYNPLQSSPPPPAVTPNPNILDSAPVVPPGQSALKPPLLPPPPVRNSQDSPSGRKFNKKKIGITAAVVLLVVMLPLTLLMVQRQQNTQQQASQEVDKVVAVLDGQITRSMVRAVAEEQYAPEAVDDQAMKDALDTLLERRLLDREKRDRGITVSQSEIAMKVDNQGLSEKQAEYSVLREKITEQSTKNWQVYTIGFWQPSGDELDQLAAEEKTQREQILAVGKQMISEAKTRLEAGEQAAIIAKSLLLKYPSFAGVLAVNGYQISAGSESTPEVLSPKIYTYDTDAIGQPFYDTVYSLTQEGEVKINDPQDGSGADAIMLVSSGQATLSSYEDWLANKKNSVTVLGL